MAEGLVTIAGGISGSGLAAGMQKLTGGAGGSGGGETVTDYINGMNNRMNKYLNMALNYSQGYTGQAVNAQNQYLNQATGALNNSLTNATNQGANSLLSAFNQSQGLQAPYALMGYNAADRYADSLGLARPAMGSANLAQSLSSAGTINPQLIQNLQAAAQAAGQNAYATGTAPTAPTDNRLSQAQLMAQLSPQQQAAMAQQGFLSKVVPKMYNQGTVMTAAKGLGLSKQATLDLFNNYKLAQSALGSMTSAQDAAYNQGQQQYQQQQGLYNNYQNAQQSLLGSLQNISPDQLKTALAYKNGLFNNPMVV